MITDNEIIAALQKVKDVFGIDHAKSLECLFRNETAHFKSGNFKVCLSPGMEVAPGKTAYPYGWTSLQPYWEINPQYKPETTFSQVENSSALLKSRGARTFIVFPNIEASMMTVAHLIKLRGGNFGSWFSTQEEGRKKYNEELTKIIPRFCRVLK